VANLDYCLQLVIQRASLAREATLARIGERDQAAVEDVRRFHRVDRADPTRYHAATSFTMGWRATKLPNGWLDKDERPVENRYADARRRVASMEGSRWSRAGPRWHRPASNLATSYPKFCTSVSG
jgi:hypothetical protein